MKKRILTFILIFLGIFITGCDDNNKELNTKLSDTINIDENGAALVCTMDVDYTEYDYTLGSKYVVFAEKDGKVTKIMSSEIINSTDKAKLEEFESYLNKNHSAAAQYNGYTFNIISDSKEVRASVTIDYSEFDFKTFLKDNEITNQDDVLTVDSVEKQYIVLGAECTRK